MNVTKIILTIRCQIFHLKYTKFNFGRPRWGAQSAPPAGFGRARENGGGNGGEGKRRGDGEGMGRMIPAGSLGGINAPANRARRRATTLISANSLPLIQTATSRPG